jgi:alkanesulfonate monooxygenase SsuD/methylene tetrahydromethanopterin reductase-like flavin-dependent oxidoreductase (luciferase family)
MRLGLLLHPERGLDAVYDEARAADRQGYDSIWLGDHLMNTQGQHGPDGPLDAFTLMTAIGALTSRVRLAWSMLNVSFRHPAMLAKVLATLDHITRGRVIATVGAGSFPPEYEAYDIPLLKDHDERVAYAREVVLLLKELWTHPAPARVSFDGKYVRTFELPFNPAPYQTPHPPIWIGGESDATVRMVKELADGWVMLTRGGPDRLAQVRAAPDWPARPITIVRQIRLFTAEDRALALAEARQSFDKNPVGVGGPARSFDEFVQREIVGTPDECLARIAELEGGGANYLRLTFDAPAQQERTARLILARLDPHTAAPAGTPAGAPGRAEVTR